jgi:Dimethyladenosine transferase (rRNA methylation)
MNEYLPGMESEARRRDLSQFYTDPELARRIVQWAIGSWCSTERLNVLEPTAGRGALVDALLLDPRVGRIDAVELDEQNVEFMRQRYAGNKRVKVFGDDFLKIEPLVAWDSFYDLSVQNTPFENGQTEAFILHALKMSKRVVAHCPLTTLAGQARRDSLWSVAYLKRQVIHSTRPSYGGDGGKTEMATFDIVRRAEGNTGKQRVAASGVDVEWWV